MALLPRQLVGRCYPGDGQQGLEQQRQAVVHSVGHLDVLVTPERARAMRKINTKSKNNNRQQLKTNNKDRLTSHSFLDTMSPVPLNHPVE